MKSKPFKIVVKLTIVTYNILIGLYCFHPSTKSHLDARQAEFFAYQLINNKYDSVNVELPMIVKDWKDFILRNIE